MNNNLILELVISDNISINQLRDIYSLIKYVPWNEKEILEVKRVHAVIKTRNRSSYDSESFNRDIGSYNGRYRVNTPHPRSSKFSKMIRES